MLAHMRWIPLLAALGAQACVVYDASLLGGKDGGTVGEAGPCSGGKTSCFGKCVDMQTDPTACGACDRQCAAQECKAGMCAPDILASALPGPHDLVVDDAWVYFGNHDSVSTQMVAKDGNSLSFFGGAQVFPGKMVLSGSTLFWTNDSNLKGLLLSIPTSILPSDVSTKLAIDLAGPSGLAIAASNAFITMGGATNASGNGCPTSAYVGQVLRCPTTGCSVAACGGGGPVAVATNQNAPHAIVADATAMFWATGDGTIATCSVPSCSGGPKALASGEDAPGALALDATDVYWTTATAIMTCPRSGCSAPTALASKLAAPRGLALEANALWYTSGDTVQRCRLPDCAGGPTVLARGLAAPWGIATYGPYAFVACEGSSGSGSVDGAIVKITK